MPPSGHSDAANPQPKSTRGGKRPGAGRKPKRHTAPAALADIDLAAALAAPAPDDIETAAQTHAREAIASLVKTIAHGRSETAKVAACNALLDRGYGKPSVDVGGLAQLTMFGGSLATGAASMEIRTAARAYANLAIETLRAIATRGETEGARVAASRSLLDRGVGTVQVAKMPEGVLTKPLGKKEEASRAAQNAAMGRYATPPPPRSLSDTVQ